MYFHKKAIVMKYKHFIKLPFFILSCFNSSCGYKTIPDTEAWAVYLQNIAMNWFKVLIFLYLINGGHLRKLYTIIQLVGARKFILIFTRKISEIWSTLCLLSRSVSTLQRCIYPSIYLLYTPISIYYIPLYLSTILPYIYLL